MKQLFVAVFFIAFYLAIVSLAARGSLAALGLSIGIAGLTLFFATYASAYWTLRLLAHVTVKNGNTTPDFDEAGKAK